MKTMIGLLCLFALLIVSRPVAAHEDCPNCVKVRVALALAQAHTDVVTKPTPEPTTTAPQPVRIYRIGSLPPTWGPPAPVYTFPATMQSLYTPAICTPGQ